MWDSLSAPWQTCLAHAWDQACRMPQDRFGFVAAAVTDDAGNVLSCGAGHDLSDGRVRIMRADGKPSADHILAHAELMALLRLDYECAAARSRTCRLYTTMEPCPLCVGAAVMSNVIAEIHYAGRDPWGGCIGMFDSTPYLQRQKQHVRIVGPEANAELEDVLTALRIAGWLSYDGREHVITASSHMAPHAAAVGKELAQAGRMVSWRRSRVPVSKVITTIHTMLSS
jgi:tRNA(adenine34) deaminase